MKTRKFLVLGALLVSAISLFAFKPASKTAYPTSGYYIYPNTSFCAGGFLDQNDCDPAYTGAECTITVIVVGVAHHYPAYLQEGNPCVFPLYQPIP